jgi:hypothetical protein
VFLGENKPTNPRLYFFPLEIDNLFCLKTGNLSSTELPIQNPATTMVTKKLGEKRFGGSKLPGLYAFFLRDQGAGLPRHVRLALFFFPLISFFIYFFNFILQH